MYSMPPFSVLLSHRSDEKIFRYLDLRRAQITLDFRPLLLAENVTPFDCHNLTLSDWRFGKEAFAVNLAFSHFGLGRAIS